MLTPKQIAEMIEAHLEGASATVEDPQNDGTHLTATVICPAFEGKSRIEQHRMVYKALEGTFERDAIHALSLRTRSA